MIFMLLGIILAVLSFVSVVIWYLEYKSNLKCPKCSEELTINSYDRIECPKCGYYE